MRKGIQKWFPIRIFIFRFFVADFIIIVAGVLFLPLLLLLLLLFARTAFKLDTQCS